MIIIPRNKQKDVLVANIVLITPRGDYKEFYKPYIQGRPFIAEYDHGDWIITKLNIDIHEALPSYELFVKNVLGNTGIERHFYINFDDKDQGLLFKLKYL